MLVSSLYSLPQTKLDSPTNTIQPHTSLLKFPTSNPFCGHIQFDHHNFFYITQLAIVLNPVHFACTEGLVAAAMVAVSTYHPPTTTRAPFFKAHLLPILRGPGTNNKLICTTKPPTITKGCPKPTINQKTSTMHPQFSMPQAHKAR